MRIKDELIYKSFFLIYLTHIHAQVEGHSYSVKNNIDIRINPD